MASIHCGQSALLPLPKAKKSSSNSKRASLTDMVVISSKSLKVGKQAALKDEGMLVYKVNKVRTTT